MTPRRRKLVKFKLKLARKRDKDARITRGGKPKPTDDKPSPSLPSRGRIEKILR